MEEVKNNAPQKKPDKAKKHKWKSATGTVTDLSLRILALIIAIIVWFVLSITQYPTINKTITSVPVDFNLAGTKAEEKGLDAINYSDITVDVEIKGMNYEIGNYTANDLSATVNLDSVTKEGTYKLDIEVKSTHSTDRCTIVSVSPETIEVDFDRITTKTVELTAEAPLITAEEGYTLKEAAVTPSEITIEGPKNELDNVSRATARISKSRKIKEEMSMTTDDIVFYDADDNKLDSSKFTIKDADEYTINFVVYKKKTVNLQVEISGAPKEFDISSLPMTLSENSISVISPDLDGSDTEDVYVGTIPLSNINLAKKFTFAIPVNSGEINLTGAENVEVSFDGEGYTSKTFTIDSSRINITDTPANMSVELETKKLTNVTIFGPESVMEQLTDDDIYARVSLSDIYEAGSYSRAATIYVPDYNNVWCYGTNDVQIVTISK